MANGVKLKGYKELTKNSECLVFNKAKYITIPLVNGINTDVSVLIKKGDYVLKGQILGKTTGNFRIPIISSVSGIVMGYTKTTLSCLEEVKSIVIENDFKEKTIEIDSFKDLRKIKKEDFITRLHDAAIIGMGGSGFPTYVKYQNNNIKTLVINAVECEPFITSDYALFMDKTEEILDAIDIIMEINNIEKCIIAVKKTNIELIKKIQNFIGSYLKIKIKKVPNAYPMGWEKTMIKQVLKKDYEKLPSEIGVVVNNVSTIYSIKEALEGNYLTQRLVTITGDVLNKTNILVKIGTTLEELFDHLEENIDLEQNDLIIGGPMMGQSIEDKNLAIIANINCILVKEKEKMEEVINCLRCGKCSDSCPAKISPVLIKDNVSNIKNLKQLNPNKCVGCGICSYVCPSRIKVREFIKQARRNLSEGE